MKHETLNIKYLFKKLTVPAVRCFKFQVSSFIFIFLITIILASAASLTLFIPISSADTIDDLRAQIKEREQEIKELETKSAQYKESLQATKKQSNTLGYQVVQIEDSISDLNIQIKKTQTKIIEAGIRIEELKNQIDSKEADMGDRKEKLGSAIRLIYQFNSSDLVTLALSTRSFSDILSQKEYLDSLQREIKNNLGELKVLKDSLEVFKVDQEVQNRERKILYGDLEDQKKIAQDEKSEKDNLLRQTKNKEKEYQKLISSIEQQRKNIEKEIGSLEEKLRAAIDRSKLPVGKGILKWPVDNIITQGYGKPNWNAAYDFHNGIDIRAAVGTPVKAALAGKVVGVGDNGRYSYGKWIAIDHGTYNITTLYGHLSLQKVGVGQTVKTGDIIGYSGNTGYSTGPHLHFTVFASENYTLIKSTKVPNLFIPVGGSINPLEYL